jgi:hypothetical protein
VPADKLLGFLVSSRSIEVNPGKIRAIERMQPLKDLKEVQKFTGCLASLSRFISRLGEQALPLYQLKRNSDTFVWMMQADAAFKDLKRMLSTAPILASPLSKEPMLLYIAETNRVVSAVVVVEREEEGFVQRPVYYLSKVLYLKEKLCPLREDDIWCLYGGQKAQALLPGAFNSSGGRGSYIGDHKQ